MAGLLAGYFDLPNFVVETDLAKTDLLEESVRLHAASLHKIYYSLLSFNCLEMSIRLIQVSPIAELTR